MAVIPEEVMMYILCWLPVISLIRFTSVSKRWRFIILSNPKFAASHFNAARLRKALGSRSRVLFSTGASQLESHDTASFGHPSSVRKLTLPSEQRGGRDVTLLGSCNGLVFAASGDSYFYVWNPATRFFKELPDPGFPDGQQLCYYGVGYLSATDDYRVLATSYGVYEDEIGYEDKAEMKIFSCRDHGWKEIGGFGPDNPSRNQGILVNEALHWVGWGRFLCLEAFRYAERGEIIAFDFTTEKFRKMRRPDDVEFGYVGVSEGCLCLCGYVSGGHDCMDFWVMREYGVYDSWTKLYNLNLSPVRRGDFLVMESCIVAVQGAIGLNWLLVKMGHKREEEIGVYVLQRIDNCRLSMLPYEESLLQITD